MTMASWLQCRQIFRRQGAHPFHARATASGHSDVGEATPRFLLRATVLPFCMAALTSLSLGCASMSHMQERSIACPYETIWETSLATLGQYPLSKQSKEKGMIETDWVVTDTSGRPYGLFRREGLGDKERFRQLLTLEQENSVILAQLTERREHFGFRGGGRIYDWYPVEPSEEALKRTMAVFTTRLEKNGCAVRS